MRRVSNTHDMRGSIIAVAAFKGGVGKTTLAYEIAGALDAVLVDLDFQPGGGATHIWGFDPRRAKRAPLLDALESPDRVPRPKHRANRPDLVPCHPDLGVARLDEDDIADGLERWAIAWQRTVVVDTLPGRHWTTDGALKIADLVVIPVTPGRSEIAATDAMIEELSGYPLLLVPNMTPAVPDARWVKALRGFATRDGVGVAMPVSEHRWLRRRVLASALTCQPNPGVRTSRAAAEFVAVANDVRKRCLTPKPSTNSTLAATG